MNENRLITSYRDPFILDEHLSLNKILFKLVSYLRLD